MSGLTCPDDRGLSYRQSRPKLLHPQLFIPAASPGATSPSSTQPAKAPTKMPKATKAVGGRDAQRHNPLAEEYVPSNPWKQKAPKRQKRTRDDNDGEHFVDSKASRKILDIGRELAEEDERENEARRPAAANAAFDFEARLGEDDKDDEDPAQYDDEEAWGEEEGEDEVEEIEIDPNDLATFNKFVPTDDNPIQWPGAETEAAPSGPGTDLAALILEKIAAAEAQNPAGGNAEGGHPEDAVELPAKVVEVYSKIGLILSRYKSGKLPKPFKILPTVPAWETLLSITRPDSWTPNAVYAATRLFISGKPHIAQQFLNMVLLPAVQQDILETKKLNVHLYAALKKAYVHLNLSNTSVSFDSDQGLKCDANVLILQSLQTLRLLQRHRLSPPHRLRLQPTRSNHHLLRPRPRLRPRPPLRRRHPPPVRTRRRADVLRPRVRRPCKHLHKNPARQEVRPAV